MATKRHTKRTQGTSRNRSSRLYDDVLALASTLMRDRQEIGGRRLKELSSSVRGMAQSLPEMPNLTSYVGTTADSLTDIADYISSSDIETDRERRQSVRTASSDDDDGHCCRGRARCDDLLQVRDCAPRPKVA